MTTQERGRPGSRRTAAALGLGCAPLANLYTEVGEDVARATVDAAWDAGIRLFDTAPLYGHGLSERRVGQALAGRPRHEYRLCTKVGRLLVPDDPAAGAEPTIFAATPAVHPVFDFSAAGVRRSVEESLERLGVDRLDVVHIHDPEDHMDQARAEAHPALVALKDEGVVGAVGVGTNFVAVADRFVGAVELDHLLLAGRHTLLDPTGALALFERCRAHGVGVLAAGVFNSGILADPEGAPFYDYAPASPEVRARARRLAEVCATHGVALAAAAVQMPSRHPAVATTLVGARTPQEVQADVALFTQDIPEALWPALAEV